MADKAPSELTVLRQEFKAATGKNASPKLTADDLRAAIAAASTPAPDDAEAEAQPEAEAPAQADADAPAAEAPQAAKKGGKKAKAAADEGGLPPHGTALIRHASDPKATISYQGVELSPDKAGLILVPLAAVDELAAHGFELVKAGN